MKKLFLFIFLGISFVASSQKTWTTFTSSNPSEPVFRIRNESNSEVSYFVEVPGMFQENVTHDTVIYQRLSVPKAAIWGYSGYPTIPAITKRFAIPECDSVIISFNDYQVLEDGYLRNQRILKLATYLIKYNPVRQQIIAYTHFELTLIGFMAESS